MTRWELLRAALALLARLYLGGVFVVASLHKLADPARFALEVASYQILPLWAINLTAICLPSVELATGLLLVLGTKAKPAALLALGMLAVFIAAIALAMHRGLHIACGCFAAQPSELERIGWPTLLRDLAWSALAIYILLDEHADLAMHTLGTRFRALVRPRLRSDPGQPDTQRR